jgi:C1A family cysteine protease
VTITTETDLSDQTGPIRNQGKRPTCIAFATSDLHAAARAATFTPLSVEYLYYHACRRSPQFAPQNGVTLTNALETVELDGQPEEVAWPYLTTLPADLNNYAIPPGITSIFRRAAEHLSPTYDTVESELRAGRPAMVIFKSSVALHHAKPDEPIVPIIGDSDTARHAVLAVGVGKSAGVRCMKVKNSWGTGWAAQGYGWMSENYFAARVIAVVRMVCP